MTKRTMSSKSIRRIIAVGLAVALALSANVALAGHQLANEGSMSSELKPTDLAGDATGKVELQIGTSNDGSGDGGGGQTPDGSSESDGNDSQPDSDSPDRDGFDDSPNHRNGEDPDGPPSSNPQRHGLDPDDTREVVSGLVTGKIQIEDLEDTDNVEVCLVDEDGDKTVSLGKLEGGTDSMLTGDLSAQVENLEDFDSVCVTRGPAEDGKVLFTAPLPHDGDGGQTPGGSSQPDSDGMEPHDETPPSNGGSPNDGFPQDEHSPSSQPEQ